MQALSWVNKKVKGNDIMSEKDNLYSMRELEENYKKFIKTPPHQLIMKLESRVKHLEAKIKVLESIIDAITENENQ